MVRSRVAPEGVERSYISSTPLSAEGTSPACSTLPLARKTSFVIEHAAPTLTRGRHGREGSPANRAEGSYVPRFLFKRGQGRGRSRHAAQAYTPQDRHPSAKPGPPKVR